MSESESESASQDAEPHVSEKKWFITFLFLVLLGGTGAHRFYTGRILAGFVRLAVFVALCVATLSLTSVLVASSLYSFWSPYDLSDSSLLSTLLRLAGAVLILVDCIFLATGRLKDGEGKFVVNHDAHIEGKKWSAVFLFHLIVGLVGGHRFYVGKIGTGVVWVLTFGVFGIGWLVDGVKIIHGTFRDKDGAVIRMPRTTFVAKVAE